MSNAIRTEITERVIMYSIPLPGVASDLSKLLQQAALEASNQHGIDTTFDDWAKVTSDGDSLTLRFTVSR